MPGVRVGRPSGRDVLVVLEEALDLGSAEPPVTAEAIEVVEEDGPWAGR